MNIKNATQAREYLEKKGINIEPGKSYNIYVCGCVVNNDDDPQLQFYFPKTKTKKRSCPYHKPSALLNKYKRCRCGREYFSNRIQSSEMCKGCYESKLTPEDQLKCLIKVKKLQNDHLRDPDRSDCAFYLTKCLMEYVDFQAVPCKNCKHYTIGTGNVDDLFLPVGVVQDKWDRLKGTSY